MKRTTAFIALLFCLVARAQDRTSFMIHFDHDKYALRPVDKTVLDSMLAVTRTGFSAYTIELHGHCDYTGTDEYNDRLSEKRVETVKKFLLGYSIPESAIAVATGHGELVPLMDNTTEEGRQANRRVEIIFSVYKLVPVTEGKTITEKIEDTATVAGTNIVLRNINFQGGRHQILLESFPMLDELLLAMQKHPKLVIEIQGHICCQPGDSDGPDNDTGLNNLSEARAKAIQDYLLAKGIAPARLAYKGFGHSKPIYAYPEKTEDERVSNRRVEIKIISK